MAHKKNTLLILTPVFPPDEQDSTCLPAQQIMVKALKRKFPFVQFVILSFEYPATKTPYRWGGNQVIPFDGRNRGIIYRLRMWYQVWRTMDALRRDNDLIGLLSFSHGECALVGKYFARLHRLRHYNWLLGQDAGEGNRYVSLTRPRAEELLAISESVAESFYIHHSVKPGHIIHNGIDPNAFPYNGICRDIDILGAGNLVPRKQYTLWVKIAGEIAEKRPGTKALLCGKGQESEKLEKMVTENGWQRNLSLTGELPHTELLGWMQRCKIFLHPSSYEGSSTTCLEALYAGAHVISFSNPTRHSIDHWHVVYSAEEMAEMALALLEDPYTDYTPVFPFAVDHSATAVMELFR